MNKKFIVEVEDGNGEIGETEVPTREEAEELRAILYEDPGIISIEIIEVRV